MGVAGSDLLTTAQAAEYLGVHPKTMERMLRYGEVRSAKIGRRYRIRREWLEAYVDAQSAVTTTH